MGRIPARLCVFVFLGLVTARMPAEARAASADASLARRLAAVVQSPNVGRMKVGVRVERLGPSPTVVFEQDSDSLFKPASNQKLVTSAAAVHRLGPGFAFRTTLALKGDDLLIVGGGDPSFGDPRMAQLAGEPITAVLRQWTEGLTRRGVTEIRGDLLFDDFVFDQQFLPNSWVDRFNLQAWYAAPVGGLNFNDNCVDLLIEPGESAGTPAKVTLIPNTAWLTLKNTAKTATSGEPLVHRRGDGPLTISVGGRVSRPNSRTDPLSIAITDPGAFAASTLRTVLASRGIRVHGETRRVRLRQADMRLPPSLTIVATHERTLGDLLWRVNKSSMNMFAEALLKTLGTSPKAGHPTRQGTFPAGRAAVADFLRGLGTEDDRYVIDDGSGLSHDNRLAPMVVTRVLRAMDESPHRAIWWANLATPGEKFSTLARRMKRLEGRVFAKTGHIGGVSALSGYVLGTNLDRYAFCVLCNDTHRAKGGTSAAHRIQNKLCEVLANWSPATSETSP